MGFVGPEHPPQARILVLGQNPGAEEERDTLPFVGKSGQLINKVYIPLAGVERGMDVAVDNILRCRHNRSNDLPRGDTYTCAVEHCTRAHFRIPDSVKAIVAVGALAWDFCGGEGKVTERRGSVCMWVSPQRTIPVLCTIHPAEQFHAGRKPAVTDIETRKDWSRVQDILGGTYPKPLPPLEDGGSKGMNEWFDQAEKMPFVVIDTEFYPNNLISIIGLAYWACGKPQGLQLDFRGGNAPYVGEFSRRLRELCGNVPIVFQNAPADVRAMRYTWDIDWHHFHRIEDTMQAHAVLYTELPHGLDWLLSMYSDYEHTKHLQHEDELKYNWGDVVHTGEVWRGVSAEHESDSQVAEVYRSQNLPLLPIIETATASGLRVNQDKVRHAIPAFESQMHEAELISQAYCGWPINPGSPDQLKKQLYDIEGLPVQKHPSTKKPTVYKDAIGEMRQQYGTVDPDEVMTVESILDNIEEGAHPLLEGATLYGKAEHTLSAYLYPLVEE